MNKIITRPVIILLTISSIFLTNKYSNSYDNSYSNKELNKMLKRMELSKPKGKIKAPNIIITNANTGKQISLKSFKGKIVFLNFWATWCPPCREEMPSMEKLYKKMKNKDFAMLAISYEDIDTLKEFQNENKYQFPIFSSPNAETKYGIQAIPATFIIDKKGYIIAKRVGAYHWDDNDSIELFNKLTK